ncbi:heme lyase CcmF/NrfE family subunit [Thioalkalivibrio paradoxus]|uniref:Heme lyase subunit CcmF n=1 Tax=Thioalkalivibrio paradoxus ARh 1 TaxID=713585 RepID=W0DRT0_9GAMM|nr:heme lyase CcmF/NrfE family subunit [Thioalkalivibrio paradoxus]AHE99570.1 heme lyase subunit CcmF [Thioalkalivibrio paradoxus ARh 1]
MVAELGLFALILALLLAIAQGTLPLIGAARGDVALMAVGRSAAFGQLFFIALAYAALTYAFVTDDFSLRYVATHSNSLLPTQYKISGVWGGHEGSLLLWVLILSLWSAAVATFSRSLPREVLARVLGVMGLVAIGFIGFTLFTSSPFERLLPAAMEGRDLNPMLQDPGLIFHPPMLYMGYVGFSVAFAFAIAALIGGRLDAAWARWSRPWTAVAWAFLTLGIGLGSWWAYYVLGWGGWWFWDPVENASFLPWLMGTALLHSLAVTEKRGGFKNWTVMLAILTFSLVLLGAFLVRSGVLTSVHAFAVDPDRGLYLLGFMAVVVAGSLTLFAWRAGKVGLGGSFGLVSRESALLTNNVLLAVSAAAVLLGTLYPLFLDAFGLGKISVGPPYFEAVFLPLMLPLLLLLGFGPRLRWKQDSPTEQLWRLRWILGFSLVFGMLWPLAVGSWSLLAGMGTFLGLWILGSALKDVVERLRRRPGSTQGFGTRVQRLGRSYAGMQIAHIGVALLVIGVTFVIGYDDERDVRMAVGETVEVGGYGFRLDRLETVDGPNYTAEQATVAVFREDGRQLATLRPQMRDYFSQDMPMAHTSLHRGLFRDLYVNMGEPLGSDAWVMRVYYKPYMNWIWTGAVLMGLGGFLAATDRRYRVRVRREEDLPDDSADTAGRPSAASA